MKLRSPSADKICAAAVSHFSERGYDASSLSEIAAQVGMRKASLYSHFASKEALFLDVFADALHEERQFVQGCFEDEANQPGQAGTTRQVGALYCMRMAQRYAQSAHLRFLLRTAYLPPAPIRAHIASGYEAMLQQLQDSYRRQLRALPDGARLSDSQIDRYAQAYLGIIDSLHVELIYAGAAGFENRRLALWQMLSDSLTLAAQSA
jgi:AcrR family transcriptional regulator